MNSIEEIQSKLLDFRNHRDWQKFHNPKDLAIAINVEAGELLELFLWKDPTEVNDDKIKEELADVLSYAFLLAYEKGFDIKEIILDKIEKNNQRYPVDKSKGNARKYNEL